MSELTRCNRCTLEAIRARYPYAVVEVKRIPPGEPLSGWLAVVIDGVPSGSTFMALTNECVC